MCKCKWFTEPELWLQAELTNAEILIKRAISSIEKKKKRLREMTVLDAVHLEFQFSIDESAASLAQMSAMIAEYKKVCTASKSSTVPVGSEDSFSTFFWIQC